MKIKRRMVREKLIEGNEAECGEVDVDKGIQTKDNGQLTDFFG